MLSPNQFTFVQYRSARYPEGFAPTLTEVAAHFDRESIDVPGPYSLHTEYSYGRRRFDTERISHYPELASAHRGGVPRLWFSDAWTNEFARFVTDIAAPHGAPSVVEVHPPFADYCSLGQFVSRLGAFSAAVHEAFPQAEIVVENRSGTTYKGGAFLMGTAREIAATCSTIRSTDIRAGIVLDFPQLLTAEGIDPLAFDRGRYDEAISTLEPHRDLIRGVHIWGKRRNRSGRPAAHAGDLESYFDGDANAKGAFISGIERICSDGRIRYFVPEVNSGTADLVSIIGDLFG
ncbi:hypothetical protein [Collinsella intestinalis]|uniref:hypothetical protein n=1 Tax=Collinsella intestinalis TaxID=147207 RepID=UPI0019576801|nr:hypothetical protein [Collinsella intestinalis]MBM6682334.1 hypothetical protein [Collinsella intestinalis]